MKERLPKLLPGFTLLLLALLSGIAWRAELELSGGWAGLTWIGYFHWAVPVCVLAFVVWVVWFARVRRPGLFAAALAVFALGSYAAVKLALDLCFDTPSVYLWIAFLGAVNPEIGVWLTEWGLPIFWFLVPLNFCLICRGFGLPITIGRALSSAVLFTASWPLAIFVRGFFEQRGAPDLIHALKSGFVVPFLVLSLGWPLLNTARRPATVPGPAGG